ncbi:lanthionine synthetase C family protein [Staphylococcus epidermidis]|uniref:PepC n=1 Tax=Staphylococcus epidermidis TaxID=1282 RepID=Q54124_STAEP|nr:lanthionine synthetase C family protein [Staphylococcus epidermidis]MCA0116990.1 lanthionine synthetase C family protein [Staphylococcus epidermidis]MCG1795595.1 lanthionine synthetase C family protein [Staphylococcus epidermidis]MCG2569471.1 lanthionine synthetase C family protein [Staphylococcus epidermidis]TBW74577.1 hypothetical protein EQ807_12195 [Staphylococcus epidermidis]TBW82640.1 hypothetical protein EQ805_12120 [Staphylococcus epidermidis]
MNRFLNTYIKQVTNIDNVDSYINNLYGPEPIYKASLITGYPGIAISLFAIYKETNNFEYYELCNKYLEKTIELINDTPMYSTSLFEGAFGTIFSLLVCSDSGSNYSNIIKNLLFEYKKISKNEIDRLRTKLKNNNIQFYEFDIISGCAGTLSLLLLATDIFPELSELLVDEIVQITSILTELVIKFNNDDYLLDTILSNLGYAHGIPGIINTLCNSYKRGYGIIKTKKILEQSIFTLLQNLKLENGTIYIPNDIESPNDYRDAWCYGLPSVAYTIFNVSSTLKNKSLIELSESLLHQVFLRSDNATKLISPTLCHGFSGVVMISLLMNNNELSSKYQKKIIQSYIDQIDGLYFDINDPSNFSKDIGLLNGNAGILLTLLSYDNNKLINIRWFDFMIMS